MPRFDYRARTVQGDLLQGALEGSDPNSVATYLLNIGATPVEIRLSMEHADGSPDDWWRRLSETKPSSLEVQLFSRQMYALLRAGVPVLRGLAGLQDSAVNRAFARVLREVRSALEAGRELSTALRSHPRIFSPYYVSMVQVGEMTGKLGEIFMRLHDYLDVERTIKEQVTAALRYPKFVLLALVGAVGVMNVYVIPAFAKIFSRYKGELPVVTRILVAASDFTIHYWPALLAMAITFILGIRAALATPIGRYRWDKLKLHLPIAGELILKGMMARFARSYALAYRSGLPVGQTLGIAAKTVDNAYVESRIDQIRDGVERGETIYRTASTSGVFTPVALQMIAVGEESGGMDKLMDEIADMYERELQYEVKTLAARMEPLMIITMAVLVLILALGVFLPMWNLGSTIGLKDGKPAGL